MIFPILIKYQSVDVGLYHSLLELRKYVVLKRQIQCQPGVSELLRAEQINSVRVKGALIDDLCLDFTLPGYPFIELIPSGRDVMVTMDNVSGYIEKVVDMTVGVGIKAQLRSFREGFDKVFGIVDLQSFDISELSILVSGDADEDWSFDSA